MAKAGFPQNMKQDDAVFYRLTPWSFQLGLAEIKAMALASGSTNVMDIPIRFMPGAAADATNYALGQSWVRCEQAFTDGATVKIVNESGVLIAGLAGGATINSTQNIVPIPLIEPAAGTSYNEAYLRITLGASTFALQTSGSFTYIGHFLTLPAFPVQ